MNKRAFSRLLISFLFIYIPSQSILAGEFVIDDLTVHYSLINSSFIEPKIATQYSLIRSKNRALLNISVVQKAENTTDETVKGLTANIFGTAVTLAGQLKELAFKEVKEQNAIYYIATFPINNGERLTFDLKVQPNKEGKLIPIKFKQQVFVE